MEEHSSQPEGIANDLLGLLPRLLLSICLNWKRARRDRPLLLILAL